MSGEGEAHGMTESTNPDDTHLVRLLRERLQRACDQLPLTREAGFDTTSLFEALDRLIDEMAVKQGPSSHPVVQAVARALVAPVDDLCETSRPMVQRIVDGEFGQDAAGAVAHLVMLLADTRGQVQALERALSAHPPLDPEGTRQHPDAVPPCGAPTGFVKAGRPEYLCQRGQGHEPPHEVMLHGGVRMAWGAEEDFPDDGDVGTEDGQS